MCAHRNERSRERRKLSVTVLGNFASSVLLPGTQFEVEALFERSLYLSDGKSFICIGEETIGAGPLNMLVAADQVEASFTDGIDRKSKVEVLKISKELWIGESLVLDFAAAGIWSPPALPDLSRETGMDETQRQVCKVMARLTPFAGGHETGDGSATEIAFRRRAGPAVQSFRQWLKEVLPGDAAVRPPGEDIVRLIGLGPGLTPSGDDFLGGALIALRALRCDRAADELASAVLKAGEARTHGISLQHLRCAAEGQGHEALHAFLLSLLMPKPEQMEQTLSRLVRLGHSSGADMAHGALIVLDAALGSAAGSNHLHAQ